MSAMGKLRTLSEHLILACLFEAVICHAKYGAAGALEEERLSEIARRIPPVAIAPLLGRS